MRYIIEDKETGKVLEESQLGEYYILYTEVNGPKDQAKILVARRKDLEY